VFIYIRIYICIFIYVGIYIYIHTHAFIYIYIYIYVYVYTCTCLYTHTCLYTYVYTCKDIYTQIYIHIDINIVYIFCVDILKNQRAITGWRRAIWCLISSGHFLRKSPIHNGSFSKNDLQLKASCASTPPPCKSKDCRVRYETGWDSQKSDFHVTNHM